MHVVDEAYNLFVEGLELTLSYLLHPRKRTYLLYLFSSLVLAFFVFKKTQVKSTFFKYIFKKKIWLGKSAFVDYQLVFFNSFIKILFIAPYLMGGLYLAFYTNEYLETKFGTSSFHLSINETLVLYTICITLANDFGTYFIHFLMHKIPYLWEFHKIHHSATVLNPFTQYRLHPVELLINNAKGILIFGFVTGFFDYFSQHQVDKLTFIGVNIFSFAFLFFGANLRHSHVKLKYSNFWECILISPFQHQIHHSDNPKHFDKNLGSKFAFWDWMFGTLVRSKSVNKIQFGLGKEENFEYNSFLKNIIAPFKKIVRSVLSILKIVKSKK